MSAAAKLHRATASVKSTGPRQRNPHFRLGENKITFLPFALPVARRAE
jgi:hypothetical protein